jgi:group I intron endonuclease
MTLILSQILKQPYLIRQVFLVLLKCLDTGGSYIGSSVNLAERFIEHVNYDYLSNICLQRSFDKHGLDAFAFSIIELSQGFIGA